MKDDKDQFLDFLVDAYTELLVGIQKQTEQVSIREESSTRWSARE